MVNVSCAIFPSTDSFTPSFSLFFSSAIAYFLFFFFSATLPQVELEDDGVAGGAEFGRESGGRVRAPEPPAQNDGPLPGGVRSQRLRHLHPGGRPPPSSEGGVQSSCGRQILQE